MSKTSAQIYSLTNLADALMCVELGADHIGVAFGDVDHLGPIQKTCAEAKYIFDNLPDNVVKIGLTIAKDVDEILADLDRCCPEVYHLSGDIRDIPPEEVQRIRDAHPGLKIMQAIPVYSGVSYEEQWPTILELIRKYEPTTDYFLIDTKDPQSTIGIGATGATHDRTIDRAIVEATKIPCIIAGGLDPDNVAEAIHTAHPYGVDTCTRTNLPKEQQDITNGLKDREKVKAFIEATKNA